jgi:hypothetical protein
MYNNQQVIEKINSIIEDQYNGYRGRVWGRLKVLHDELRGEIGDKAFLDFLEKAVKENPKPKYIPIEDFWNKSTN